MPTDPLLAEIDDDLRREKMRALWRAVGSYIITVTGMILLGTIAIVGWQSYQNSRAEALTAQLLDARRLAANDRTEDALTVLDGIISTQHKTLSPLAMLWGAKLTGTGNKKELQGAYLNPLLNSPSTTDPYNQFAHLLAENDGSHLGKVLSGPFALTSREITANRLLKEGTRQEAADQYRFIIEAAGAPETMRQRARLILATELADIPVSQKATTPEEGKNPG
jgi:hypothetical protein